MAIASCAWLSVMVRRGVVCLKPQTIVCSEWTGLFSRQALGHKWVDIVYNLDYGMHSSFEVNEVSKIM